jgi:hypothetical protein
MKRAAKDRTMKRAAKDRPVKRTGNVRKDLSENQLAWIGSVALAYNETELILDLILTSALGQNDLGHALTSRINGTEGKIEILKTAIANLKAEQPIRDAIALTLGADGFSGLKKYRDRVIHARIRDAKNAIAQSPASRGKFEEVLLTEKALEGVYNRLVLLRAELSFILQMVIGIEVAASIGLALHHMKLSSDDPYKRAPETESRIQAALAQLQLCRRDRLSLQPLPKFPSESELNEADVRAKQEDRAETMKDIPLADLPHRLSNLHPPVLGLSKRDDNGDK